MTALPHNLRLVYQLAFGEGAQFHVWVSAREIVKKKDSSQSIRGNYSWFSQGIVKYALSFCKSRYSRKGALSFSTHETIRVGFTLTKTNSSGVRVNHHLETTGNFFL